MAKSKVNVQVDGTMVLVALVVVGVGYAYYKKKEIAEIATVGLNPTHQNNYVNQVAQNVVGSENLQTGFDYVFAAVDVLNPFAADYRKDYARSVLGLSND
jgi:Tfp pilus assembly protein PilO